MPGMGPEIDTKRTGRVRDGSRRSPFGSPHLLEVPWSAIAVAASGPALDHDRNPTSPTPGSTAAASSQPRIWATDSAVS